MIQRAVTTVIDRDKCIGCGECVRVCPSQTLEMQDGKAVVTGARSLACGHCVAVCPVEAVRVEALDPHSFRFHTFACRTDWMPWGACDAGELVRLMASRRSCRNFTGEPVPRPVLEDLVKIGSTAPSGTNSQGWTFTTLAGRAAVIKLGNAVGAFFKRINRMAENPLLRHGLRLIGRPELAGYYRDYHQSVAEGLADWEERGRDRLLHGAPAVIIVGSLPGGSCPAEDALLATQNILLAAHALGLGTCLIGFAVSAMQKDGRIKDLLKIPREETVHAVIALGHPAVAYQRLTGRKKAVSRFVEP
ncbi:MAG TPA: nitroreductase family protein [Desulfobacterales bacterium]|jgi:nitroreductase/ferredoxin|nr:nitroreductase family protein [Desulfobacterales bacterium]